MARILNVVSSLTAELCIRKTRPLEDVKAPRIGLQFGELPFDFSEENLMECTTSNYQSDSICRTRKSAADLLADWKAFLDIDFQSYDEVVVWHGDVPSEHILLNLMSKISPENLFVVDLRKATAVYEQKCEKDKNWTISFDMLSSDDYYKIDADKVKSKVSVERICRLREQWDEWAKSKCRYRLNDEYGEVRGYPDDVIDDEIFRELSSAKNIFMAVGEVMASSRFWLSGVMVLDRIISLLLEKKLKVVL